MEHNLDGSLNLESDMGVDFEQAEDAAVIQTHSTLHRSGLDENISMSTEMEFDNMEEQTILMETEAEEIIVPELIDEQFTLNPDTEYPMQDEIVITSPETTLMDMTKLETATLQIGTKSISIPSVNKQEIPTTINKLHSIVQKSQSLSTSGTVKQIAIAPRPTPRLTIDSSQLPTFSGNKQWAIAPKPVSMVAGKASSSGVVKKMSIAGVMHGTPKPGTMLAQFGKQFVVMPTSPSQRMKLVQGSGLSTVQYLTNNEQGQLLQTKNLVGAQNQKFTKVILQSQQSESISNQSSVITKLNTCSSTGQTHFVTVQRQVPAGNKVVISSPSKQSTQNVRVVKTKQPIVAVSSPSAKLLPATGTSKKIVLSASPNQNVVIRPNKSSQVLKSDGKMIVSGTPRTQLHQINVPGKGVQYIRLVTASPPVPYKGQSAKTQGTFLALPSKTLLLTDTKGNLIQMATDKTSSSQTPQVVPAVNNMNKIAPKPMQKLMRIAPVAPKTSNSSQYRSSQSLLVPLKPSTEVRIEKSPSPPPVPQVEDPKCTLQTLIEETVMDVSSSPHIDDVEEETKHEEIDQYEKSLSPIQEDDTNSMDCENRNEKDGDLHSVFVFPRKNFSQQDDQSNLNPLAEINTDIFAQYNSPKSSQTYSDNVELSLRPRKACNCTKSQCLKLYCDCFANGEFCNNCNCTNCHNNLKYEELRQKAIRGCLERNPHAFRPKIGKAKSTIGPDTVRRHNKGCNCKRSGCLKNYCECYEAKIACSAICKCVGCRNVEDSVERFRRRDTNLEASGRIQGLSFNNFRPVATDQHVKQPCSFMTPEVIEAVCQCLLAAATESDNSVESMDLNNGMRSVLEEFARCLQDIIGAAHHSAPFSSLLSDEGNG